MNEPKSLSIEGPAVLPSGIRPVHIEIDREAGKIARIGRPAGDAELRIGSDGLILPGIIDLHVHAREDATGKHMYKEDFASAGAAAIHGGVVAIGDMPNNPAPPVDDASYLQKKLLARSSPIDVLLYAGIGRRTRPLTFPAPYKAFMGPSIGEMFFDGEAPLREALGRYRGMWVAFHAESPEILARCKGYATHAGRRPPEAEVEATRLALDLAAEFGLEAHICHVSTAGALDLIRAARRARLRVTCEVAHHLFFDLEGLDRYPRPGFLQCNPPIRPRSDRLAILDALRAGDIDWIASDHAPHSLEEKERGTSGVPHLDTMGPFLAWLAAEARMPWEAIAAAACARPGEFLSRWRGEKFGAIAPGAVASLAILDLSAPAEVDRASLRTRSGWSPFEGMLLPARVTHTIVRGRVHPAGPV